MSDPIIMAMASFPPRKKGMLRVLRDLLPQCDKFYVYMNGYTEVPKDMPQSPKLEIILAGPGMPNPDMGSQGKLHWIGIEPGYYLTVDDDLLYPPDYASVMVQAVERYGRKAIVTAHGSTFKLKADGTPLPTGFMQDCRRLYAYDQCVTADTGVHMNGNACTASYPQALGLNRDVITGEINSSDDADTSVWAQKHGVAVIRIITPGRWITADNSVGMCDPLHRRMRTRILKDRKFRSVRPWRLPPFPAKVPGFEAKPPVPVRPVKPSRVVPSQRCTAPRLPSGRITPRKCSALPRPMAPVIPANKFTGWPVSDPPATAPVTVVMASFPPRRRGMLRVINALLPQCDRFCLYLNGYTEIPQELPTSPKLEIVLAGPGCEAPDKGSQGKHHWLDVYGDSYYLTVDDDIEYPPDYVSRMVSAIERYGRRAIVTTHGARYKLGVGGHIPTGDCVRKFRTLVSYDKECAADIIVHACGNGCTGCHPRTLGLTTAVTIGPLHSGDDGDYALWAQEHEVPIVRIATPANWMRPDLHTCHVQAQYLDPQRTALQDAKTRSWTQPWRLFPAARATQTTGTAPAPLITVSMTTYNTPTDMLVRAVDSVLAQTEARIELVVVNDGGSQACWAALAHITDPRLHRLDMPVNVGTYACHAETLRRCTTPWWSPHDSDDYSNPDRYAAILAETKGMDVVLGGYTDLCPGTTPVPHFPHAQPRVSTWGTIVTSVWAGGLWRTEWLQKAGIDGRVRVGYDSVLQTLARSFARVKTVDNVSYNRCVRAGSLTTATTTGVRSNFRTATCAALAPALQQAVAAPDITSAGQIMLAPNPTIPVAC